MAEHFDLLANISFHGCDIDELEFTKLYIIEKIKDYDRKVRYELNQKNDITAIFNDNATYAFYTSNPYTQDLRLKQVTYSMIYLSIGCNNYNMNIFIISLPSDVQLFLLLPFCLLNHQV